MLVLVMLRFHKEKRGKKQRGREQKEGEDEKKKRLGELGLHGNSGGEIGAVFEGGCSHGGMEEVVRGEDQRDIW